LGAPLGGTTVGGQYGLDSSEFKLITPPKGAGGGGRYLPSIVVVALGEPGTPVVCWAPACKQVEARSVAAENASVLVFMTGLSSRHAYMRTITIPAPGYYLSPDVTLTRPPSREIERCFLPTAKRLRRRVN
jgi:hypothetical protein